MSHKTRTKSIGLPPPATPSAASELLPSASSNNRPPSWLPEIHVYRHLRHHLASLQEKRQRSEQEKATAIRGPRAAAVMAALWAHREFGFEPRPQNWYAKKLAIGLGEMGRLLTQLEQANCVELVSHRHSRHNLYKITDLGKRQIEDWVEAHYGDDLFASAFKEKDTTPDPNKVARILERFRASLRDELSH